MPSPSTASAPGTSRRDLLATLGMALQKLAERILPQADAARDVAKLATRAEDLASEAWTLSATRTPDPARTAALEAEFRAFLDHAASLAQRTGRAAASCREVSHALDTQATELASLSRDSATTADVIALRTRLRPVLGTLEHLVVRIDASDTLAEDVAALGTRAAALGEEGLAAQERRIPANQKALALYRSLRGIADEAGAVAATLLAEAQQLRGTIGGIATHMGALAATSAEAPPANAEARLAQVVAHGTGAPATPPPPGQRLDWGLGRRS